MVGTDYKPLIYIFKNTEGKSKLARWALKLQRFDLQVEYVAGKVNVLADFVSRVLLQRLEGLLDEAAFDLSREIPPTSAVFAALEEWRKDFN